MTEFGFGVACKAGRRLHTPAGRILEISLGRLPGQQAVPLAHDKIVFDRFHIMQHMTEAVDDVSKQEHRTLSQEGNDSLKGTKYL
jgi:hypothetical protein